MNKYKALNNWFNQFGIPFYLETNVPSENEIEYPYGTYQSVIGNWTDEASIAVRVYDRSNKEIRINKFVDSLAEQLKHGTMVLCDEGAMHLTAGSPFCQAITDKEDRTIRSRYINVNIEYLIM